MVLTDLNHITHPGITLQEVITLTACVPIIFTPVKDENDDYGWFTEETLPSPLHPGFRKSLEMIKPLLSLRENLKLELKKLLNG